MCGVSGIITRHSGAHADGTEARSAVTSMMHAMHHRGPDGSGIFERGNVILGHNRLSVIDLVGGAQPLCLQNGRLAVSYNGETYNFNELRNTLAATGTVFKTHSDTEVVLQSYASNGINFDQKLNGMYSYAIFDGRGPENIVQLGIDPVAIKPLFLFQNDDFFIFASELRAVAAAMKTLKIARGVDPQAARAYLRYGFVPAPMALLRGVRAFAPGDRCRIDSSQGSVEWLPPRMRPRAPIEYIGERSLKAQLSDHLIRAIKRQIVADVPVGFFLSGGIDSSLLISAAARIGIQPKSFTIRFTGAGHGVSQANEADIAAQVARLCGSEHHEIALDSGKLLYRIDDTFDAMDQPLADPACLPLYELSKFARSEVTVCLAGDGGDEVFAGYPRHRFEGWKQHWRYFPKPFSRAVRAIFDRFPTAPGTGVAEMLRKAKVGFSLIDDPDYITGPFGNDVQAADFDWNKIDKLDAQSLMDADIDGQLAGQLLPKTDSMTMAASIECRVPLLDLELIDFASSLPLSAKLGKTRG